jgi:hypothetical protein
MGLEQLADLLGVGGFHRLPAAVDVADGARGVYYEGGAFGDAQKAEHAVLAGDFLFRVTQQGEREAQLLRKAAVGFLLVDADTQNLGARCFKGGKTILVCLEFLRSARGTGINVKSQNDTAFSPKIAKPDPVARVIGQFKIRRRVSDVQFHPGCL